MLGVNTLDEHLSYITLRGARKRDHPAVVLLPRAVVGGLSRHRPSTSRGSRCALSQGEQVNRILVLEPTTTAWMYQGNEAEAEASSATRSSSC